MGEERLADPSRRTPLEPEREAAGGWTTGPRVGDVGEFAVIARLRDWIARPAARGEAPSARAAAGRTVLQVGPGDDAAVLRPDARHDLVWTCDIQIEGRHFLPDWMSPAEVGARAAEINLSDIAAMGAEPVAALVSLGLPAGLGLGALEEIYRGLDGALRRWGALIAGGNITKSARLLLDITLLGRVERGRALLRSSARPGDVVFATGRPGRSAAALAMRAAGGAARPAPGSLPAEVQARLRAAHVAPQARIAAGRYLVENRIAAAAIDQSDGLAGDLLRICEESRVGIVLEESLLPVDPDLERLGAALGIDPLVWVLGASDDYELLCTVPPAAADRVFAIPAALQVPVTAIGRVAAGSPQVAIRTSAGATRALGGGWDHFADDARGRPGSPRGPAADNRPASAQRPTGEEPC